MRSPPTTLRASDEHLVGAQQRFGQDRAPVRAVVERALEIVRRRVLPGDVGVRRQQPRQRIDALGHHRIALERHRRTADLLFAERLEDLAEAGRTEDAHVGGELRERRAEAGERARAAGSRACADRFASRRRARSSSKCGEHVALLIARGVRPVRPSSRAYDADVPTAPRMPLAVSCSRANAQRRAVDQQILRVHREPVADRRRLGRLQVRVAHADGVGVAFRSARRTRASSSSSDAASMRERACAGGTSRRYPRCPSRSRRGESCRRRSSPARRTRESRPSGRGRSRARSRAPPSSRCRSPCARRSSSSACDTRPLRSCDSASATQTARQSLRRSRSENSSRSSSARSATRTARRRSCRSCVVTRLRARLRRASTRSSAALRIAVTFAAMSAVSSSIIARGVVDPPGDDRLEAAHGRLVAAARAPRADPPRDTRASFARASGAAARSRRRRRAARAPTAGPSRPRSRSPAARPRRAGRSRRARRRSPSASAARPSTSACA